MSSSVQHRQHHLSLFCFSVQHGPHHLCPFYVHGSATMTYDNYLDFVYSVQPRQYHISTLVCSISHIKLLCLPRSVEVPSSLCILFVVFSLDHISLYLVCSVQLGSHLSVFCLQCSAWSHHISVSCLLESHHLFIFCLQYSAWVTSYISVLFAGIASSLYILFAVFGLGHIIYQCLVCSVQLDHIISLYFVCSIRLGSYHISVSCLQCSAGITSSVCILFAVFSLGNIIYLIMELEANMGETESGCYNPPFGWIFIFRLLFTAAQTFFLFKNPVVSERMKRVGQGIYILMILVLI